MDVMNGNNEQTNGNKEQTSGDSEKQEQINRKYCENPATFNHEIISKIPNDYFHEFGTENTSYRQGKFLF